MENSVDPASMECDVVLADGGTVHIRAITPADGEALVAMHMKLSPETQYMRFFTVHPRLTPTEVEWFTNVDLVDRVALVATLHDDIIAVARYDRSVSDPTRAEVAFVVDDAHQGRGLGTLLLEHLAVWARQGGIRCFMAETLPHNHGMQEVFRRAGFVEKARFEGGVVEVEMIIEATDSYIEAVEQRDRRASIESIRRLLRPRSVAVIGAGRDSRSVGHAVFRNLILGEFTGTAYPVHPTAGSVSGVRSYPSVIDVPDRVDLAVIAVPGDQLDSVIAQCAEKKVNAVAIITGEAGGAGPDPEGRRRHLVRLARGSGMRVLGPDSMGLVNTSSESSLNATFVPAAAHRGRVACASQSGTIGVAVLEEARARGLGLSSFVSMGDKADVSSNDLIQYWEQDPDTDVIALYLESFGNPRKFARIARRVSKSKPIVAVKAGHGRGPGAGSGLPESAPTDHAVDALFHQAGVIRVDTLGEMFDVARTLSTQPVPAGRRVAIVGNSVVPACDACLATGLELPELAAGTQARLRQLFPGGAGPSNPVLVPTSATAHDYHLAVRLVLADDDVDAVLVSYVPTLDAQSAEVRSEVEQAASAGPAKPVVASLVGMPAGSRSPDDGTVPVFAFPEPAVRALARACEYGEWRAKPVGEAVAFADLDIEKVRRVVAEASLADPGGSWLDPAAVGRVLDASGIVLDDSPVMSGPTETVVGLVTDPAFGPLVMLGASSGSGQLPRDRAYRILPVSDADAAELVRSALGPAKRPGPAGPDAVDLAALEAVVLRVALLADEVPEIECLELDPLTVTSSGAVARAARIRVGQPPRAPDRSLRRLR